MEDPKKARGLVKREVTRVLTPGTVVEDYLLEERRNNYLAAVVVGSSETRGAGGGTGVESAPASGGEWGLAAVDCSTG